MTTRSLAVPALLAALFVTACTASASVTPTPVGSGSPAATMSTAPSSVPTIKPITATSAMPSTGVEMAFKATMTADEATPPTTSTGTGTATATLSADMKTLTLTATVSGLTGPITMAHIHQGAKGDPGPVVKPLKVEGNTLTVTWGATDAENPLTPSFVEVLKNGDLYVNVHTEKYPDGELRGQLMVSK